MPGNVETCGAITMKFRPSAIIEPHTGVGGGGPRPRNDSPDSVMMAPETRSARLDDDGRQSRWAARGATMIARLAHAGQARRLDVGLLLHREHVAAGHAREGRDEAHRHRDDHVASPRSP